MYHRLQSGLLTDYHVLFVGKLRKGGFWVGKARLSQSIVLLYRVNNRIPIGHAVPVKINLFDGEWSTKLICLCRPQGINPLRVEL